MTGNTAHKQTFLPMNREKARANEKKAKARAGAKSTHYETAVAIGKQQLRKNAITRSK